MLTQLQHQTPLFSLNPWLPATIAMAGDGKHLAVVMAKGYTQPLYGLAEEGAQMRYYNINSYTRTPELVKTELIEGELLVNSAEWDADHVTLCYATMDVFNAYKLHRSNAFGQSKFTYTDVLPKPAMLARGANHKLFANALGLNNLYELGSDLLLATNIGIPGMVVNGTMPYQHQLIFDKEKEEQNLYARELGNKLYEITDHLGNVRATISDKLAYNGTTYEADLTSASTYYPFGMSIGTLSDISDYRFGFNGMERDDEVKGAINSYTTLFRMNDVRLVRWWSVDPKFNLTPSESPYLIMKGNPIWYTDPLGDWVPEKGKKGQVKYTAEKDDNFNSFMKQYGLKKGEATEIFKNQGLNDYLPQVAENGETMSLPMGGFEIGDEKISPLSINLDKVLKVDFENSQDENKINQILFGLKNEEYNVFRTDKYFKNIPYLHKGKTIGFGGAAFLRGNTPLINGNDVYIQMMFDHKNKQPIRPQTSENWYVEHDKYYYFHYSAYSGSSRPTVPLYIKFQGEQNMLDFTKKYGSKFSGKIK